jgi:hypothetical protein
MTIERRVRFYFESAKENTAREASAIFSAGCSEILPDGRPLTSKKPEAHAFDRWPVLDPPQNQSTNQSINAFVSQQQAAATDEQSGGHDHERTTSTPWSVRLADFV